LTRSRQPWVSLVFLMPMLVFYEAGVLWNIRHGQAAGSAGAYEWILGALDNLGFGDLYLPPVVVVMALWVWHVVEGHSWRVSWRVPAVMWAEGLLLAVALLGVMYGLCGLMESRPELSHIDSFQKLLTRVGAGIYEETLFRLLLLPLVWWAGIAAGLSRKWGGVVAVVCSSVVFAVAHHLGPFGEAWSTGLMILRISGGLFLATVFVYRGFGLAVAAHAIYDVLVG
jgi:membrane protease YdiL (CAAX protease family)